MALLAEEIVEEWLNRDGWFTIRGAKLGVHEIDILAVKLATGTVECRQVEVQVSIFPISYISRVPKAEQTNGRSATSAKTRPIEELRIGIQEWIAKKFDHPRKKALLSRNRSFVTQAYSARHALFPAGDQVPLYQAA